MKTFNEFYEKIFEELQERKVLNKLQRRKIALRMKRLAKSSAFQKKKQRAMLKMPSPDKIRKMARKAARKKIALKNFPKYNEMSVAQKIKADEQIEKRFGKAIEKDAKKLIPTIRKKVVDRIAKAKEKAKG